MDETVKLEKLSELKHEKIELNNQQKQKLFSDVRKIIQKRKKEEQKMRRAEMERLYDSGLFS